MHGSFKHSLYLNRYDVPTVQSDGHLGLRSNGQVQGVFFFLLRFGAGKRQAQINFIYMVNIPDGFLLGNQ